MKRKQLSVAMIVLLFVPQVAAALAPRVAALPFASAEARATSARPTQVEPLASAWSIETVDDSVHSGEASSLALDSAGRPHVSYSAGAPPSVLKYAHNGGEGWQSVQVASPACLYYCNSLALDPADRPRISYYDDLNNWLMYARDDGSGWQLEVVDNNAEDVGAYSSLALDSANHPHISYQGHRHVIPHNLRYAHSDGGSWQLTLVDQGASTGLITSLELDAQDRPHVSYYEGGGQDLRYAYYDGSAWHMQTVDSTGTVGNVSSLALDAAGRPHISYDDMTNDTLKYAHWTGSEWVFETVASVGTAGAYSSLALDSAGRPHISYYDGINHHLMYGSYDGSEWTMETVDGAANVGTYTSLALDALGRAHISYHDEQNGALKYATQAPVEPTYSISGNVSDGAGAGIPDVVISASPSGSASTDANGNYVLSGLPAGSYTLTPVKPGYLFTPSTLSVTVPPDAAGQDFVGTPADTEPPAAVADLRSKPGDNGGVVQLTWLAPGDDGDAGLATQYDIRYSDVPIVEANWGQAITVPVEIPLPGPPDSLETLIIPQMPLTTRWYYALKTRDEVYGHWSGLSNVPSLQDIGLRPNPDGYGFPNYRGWYPLPPWWSDYTSEDMVRMFGADAVCWTQGFYCILKPAAAEWLLDVNSGLNWGHCFGMAATSLRFYTALDSHPGSVFGLGLSEVVTPKWNGSIYSTTVRRHIAYLHVLQVPSSMKSYFRAYRATHTPSAVLSDLSDRWRGPLAGWPVLSLYGSETSLGGHTILPYALEDLGDGATELWVYENQYYGQPGILMFSDAAGWFYRDNYHGGPESHLLALTPMSLLDTQPSCSPWCDDPGALTENATGDVWLTGSGHLLITDSLGRRIGFVGQEFVNEVPGAYESPIMAGLDVILEPHYTIPLTQTYSVLLDGQTLTETKTVGISQFGPGYAAKVLSVALEPATQDMMTIAPDGTEVTYQAGQAKDLTLVLARDGAASGYRFAIEGIDLGVGQQAGLTDVEADGLLAYSHVQAGSGVYDLNLQRSSVDGQSTFLHRGIEILQSDTHYLDYENWDGGLQMQLLIDHGSDGTIDEGVSLENEVSVAGFSGTPTAGPAPLEVTFTNESTGDWTDSLWDFGDGITSTLESPIHVYAMPATYTVTLTVSGPGGTDSLTRPGYIAVYDPVSAGFEGDPTSGLAPLQVSFTNQSSGDYSTCAWTFGDGETSANCDDPTHTYAAGGIYTVSLTVSGAGGSDAMTRPDYITVYVPVSAGFAGDPTGGAPPLAVSFTNQSTGDYTTCAWAFGDGGTSSSCGNPEHTYPQVGVYTVALTVSGPGGTDTLTRTDYIWVSEDLQAGFSAEPTEGPAPLLVSFTNSSAGEYDTCAWDFGDGGTSSDCDNPDHTYAVVGVYSVALTVSGPAGSDTLTRNDYITVFEPVTAGFVGSPTDGPAPLVVSFTNQSTGDYTTCNWLFGDGGTSSSCGNPAHTYTTAGLYAVTLTVTGPGGVNTLVRPDYIEVASTVKLFLPLVTRLSGGGQSDLPGRPALGPRPPRRR